MRLRFFSFVAVLAVGTLAHADHPEFNYSVDGGKSQITYHLVHKLHRFDGTSHKIEGRARVSPEGQAQVMVRAGVESFDSANSNRDEHMKETVEAARFPTVELKALGSDGFTPPATFPTALKKTVKAQLSFHGVQNVFDLPVDLEWASMNEVKVSTTFTISLEAYKIDRPSLMFVKVDDAMQIDVKLVFHR